LKRSKGEWISLSLREALLSTLQSITAARNMKRREDERHYEKKNKRGREKGGKESRLKECGFD
jgi:PHD/YefM family antitoxin component YafN of YafNO toxin-antitoxin module